MNKCYHFSASGESNPLTEFKTQGAETKNFLGGPYILGFQRREAILRKLKEISVTL